MNKSAIIWVITGLLIVGVLIVAIEASRGDGSVTPALLEVISINGSDQVIGKKDAKVVLVEYSDFQCPACALYFPVIEQLINELGDKIAFVYRHFPLSQHQHAKPAAYAAEAAGRQGKFWEMYRLIFENQRLWQGETVAKSEKIFADYAQQIGLNLTRYAVDINDPELKTKVELDFQSGLKLGVNSTPTFYLNGQKILNPRGYDEFRALIQTAIDGTN